jgi:ribosomal protein S18 acetylase RimI-like enzyme
MQNNDGVIRDASIADVAAIRSIARAAYARYLPRIGREPAPMLADFAAEVAARRLAVIEADGSVVGYIISWAESDAYLVDNIAIDPAQQGKGHGRRLLDHAVREARRLGLPAVRLYTNVAMTENLSIYAHLGFVETHRGTEEGFQRVHLRLSLSPAGLGSAGCTTSK